MVRRYGPRWTVAIVLSGACAQSTAPSAMGNTNWLTLCSDDGDCDGVTSCSCGVCAHECGSSSDCTALPFSACVLVSAQPSCDGTAAVEQVCLAQCRADADCGEGARCERGSCVGTAGPDDTVDAQQLGGVWVFTYATPPQGSDSALMVGQASVVDGCLLVNGAAVVWHEAQLPTIQQVIDAIVAGAMPTVTVGGGGLSLEEGSTLDDFPAAIVSRCSPTVVWFASAEQVTVEGL